MSKIWYIGNNISKRDHIFFNESCYEDFVQVVEKIDDLNWKEDIVTYQNELWKDTPEYYKTSATFDYDETKMEHEGLSIWYDKNTNRVLAFPRNIRNKRSIEIIFDIAEALHAKVYQGSAPRTREKYMLRYTEVESEKRKQKNVKKKSTKKSFWDRLLGK